MSQGPGMAVGRGGVPEGERCRRPCWGRTLMVRKRTDGARITALLELLEPTASILKARRWR
eukprot:2757368-Alexandrium_andersonii.AAC.1